MQARYGIDGVPAVIVNGKYRTSPSQTGGTDRFVETLNALVAQEVARQVPPAPCPAAPASRPAPAQAGRGAAAGLDSGTIRASGLG